jgi:hypothetical protein
MFFQGFFAVGSFDYDATKIAKPCGEDRWNLGMGGIYGYIRETVVTAFGNVTTNRL